MKAEIFAIGTELLMGELTDANSAWLATRLPALGIALQRVCLLGDHLATLSASLFRALQEADLLVTTGGMGPTQDDLTREAIAAALHETTTVHAETLKAIEHYFRQRGRDMPAPNVKQAHSIPSSQFLPNPYGSAPGWWMAGRIRPWHGNSAPCARSPTQNPACRFPAPGSPGRTRSKAHSDRWVESLRVGQLEPGPALEVGPE